MEINGCFTFFVVHIISYTYSIRRYNLSSGLPRAKKEQDVNCRTTDELLHKFIICT